MPSLNLHGQEGALVLDAHLYLNKHEVCLLILGLVHLLCLALHACFQGFWVPFCLVCSTCWALAKKESGRFPWLN